jgi:hypothetical protein
VRFQDSSAVDLLLKYFYSHTSALSHAGAYARFVEDFPAQIEAFRRTQDLPYIARMHCYSFEHSVVVMNYQAGSLLRPNEKNFVYPSQQAIEGAIDNIHALHSRGVECGSGGDDFIYTAQTDAITILDPKFRTVKWLTEWQQDYKEHFSQPVFADARLAIQLLWFLEILKEMDEKKLSQEWEAEEYRALIMPLVQKFFRYNNEKFPEKIGVVVHEAGRSRCISKIFENSGIYSSEEASEYKNTVNKNFLEGLIA